ncbi:MAG: hypothetical protein WCG15_00235 [Actinomycetes bacterium]
MAQKPDGKAARTERVTFTRPAAERIAKVVRAVEGGDRDTPGIYFGSAPGAAAGKTFRVCTFTGAWSINASKTVTFKNQTTTPNTVSATNLFLGLPENGTRNCGIAKDGTGWYLIQWQMDAATALSGATLGAASLEFSRINVASLGTATTVSIAVTTCSTAAS